VLYLYLHTKLNIASKYLEIEINIFCGWPAVYILGKYVYFPKNTLSFNRLEINNSIYFKPFNDE